MEKKTADSQKSRFFIKIVLLWALIFLFIKFSFSYGLDKKAMTVGVIIFGFFTNAFSGLLALIGMIPFWGPLLVKILSWPVFITINGLAYIITFFAFKSGLVKETVNSKFLATAFLLGILFGFILGKIF